MRSRLHRPVYVGKALERSGSVVCRWKQDYRQHIVLDSGFANVVQAIHQALVLVTYLYCLPLAASRVPLGSVGGKDCGRRARDCEHHH